MLCAFVHVRVFEFSFDYKSLALGRPWRETQHTHIDGVHEFCVSVYVCIYLESVCMRVTHTRGSVV